MPVLDKPWPVGFEDEADALIAEAEMLLIEDYEDEQGTES